MSEPARDHGAPAGSPAGAAGLVAALTHIDGVGFHGIAPSIGRPTGTVDPEWPRMLRNAATAVAVVSWPSGLEETAKTFVDSATRLAEVLGQGDRAAASGPARQVHGAYHALSDGGWEHLAEAAGLAPLAREEHHQHPSAP